jgi:methionyl-tRNA formyltransferase
MRVAVITRLPVVAMGLSEFLGAGGHEAVGVVTTSLAGERYGASESAEDFSNAVQAGLPVAVAASPSEIAGRLAELDADVALTAAFPLLIPADALGVLRFGIVNTHPALLPRYRGPNPIAWTVRDGEPELGYSVHRMDADFDTGPLLAQGTTRIDDVEHSGELFGRMFALLRSLLPGALARVEAGDAGDPQPREGASYAGFFEPEYAEIDWSKTPAEVCRQVLAWRVAAVRPEARGALTAINGKRVRILDARPHDRAGGTRMQSSGGPVWIVDSEPA